MATYIASRRMQTYKTGLKRRYQRFMRLEGRIAASNRVDTDLGAAEPGRWADRVQESSC